MVVAQYLLFLMNLKKTLSQHSNPMQTRHYKHSKFLLAKHIRPCHAWRQRDSLSWINRNNSICFNYQDIWGQSPLSHHLRSIIDVAVRASYCIQIEVYTNLMHMQGSGKRPTCLGMFGMTPSNLDGWSIWKEHETSEHVYI